MKRVVVWGGTGQFFVLQEFISEINIDIIAIIDNDRKIVPPARNIPIYYGIKGFMDFYSSCRFDDIGFIIAIGGDNGLDRHNIANLLVKHGVDPVTVIHPKAYVAKTASIGVGCQILAGAVVGARSIIGDYSILNTSCSVDHECQLGKSVHIAPGSVLTGQIVIGDYAFIGAGTVILPRISIGHNALVGAGSVVTKNIPNNAVCFGNPAKIKNYR